MSTARFALFVDLENCGAKVSTLNNILDKVKIRGDILLGKVYGYTDRFSDLKEVLLSNTFTVVPSIRHGISQKNNADILLVIDALEVAYTNPLIDSFCIVSGDSDYTPLVGKLKSMGKFVLGISRSEVASNIFINACNEFQFLESVSSAASRTGGNKKQSKNEPLDLAGLNRLIEKILTEQSDEGEMYASEVKGTLLRLRPDFNEKAFGCSTFGKLLSKLAKQYSAFRIKNDNFNVFVSLNQEAADNAEPAGAAISGENWQEAFRTLLRRYREDGFERINPSILKADIQTEYPAYSEKNIGFKRFSDVLKELEKANILKLEKDEQNNLLVRVL